MRYAPTLGGILRLQNKLGEIGLPVPIFEDEIYVGAEFVIEAFVVEGCRYRPGHGRRASIEQLIAEVGESKIAYDCRLSSEDGKRQIEFSHPRWCPMVYGLFGHVTPNWVHIEMYFPEKDKNVLETQISLTELVNIARWGKQVPTFWDRLVLKCLPWFYRFPPLA